MQLANIYLVHREVASFCSPYLVKAITQFMVESSFYLQSQTKLLLISVELGFHLRSLSCAVSALPRNQY